MRKLWIVIIILFFVFLFPITNSESAPVAGDRSYNSQALYALADLEAKPLAVETVDGGQPVQETKEKVRTKINQPIARGLTPEIEALIRTYKWNFEEAIIIFNCESGFNPYAHNPETTAIQRGITRHPSCGIAQINSSLCNSTDSILFDPKTNLDYAWLKYSSSLKRSGNGWYPWKNCAIKNNLL